MLILPLAQCNLAAKMAAAKNTGFPDYLLELDFRSGHFRSARFNGKWSILQFVNVTRVQQSQSDLADSAGRAIKHAVTALEIADGDRADDGEDHLQAAVCRMAMALCARNSYVELDRFAVGARGAGICGHRVL